MVYRSSFSQHILFEKCEYSWYLQYIKKIPVISDMCNAEAGNVIHKTLQKFYDNKQLAIEELKLIFNNLWKEKKLDETKLMMRKDEFWLMVLNGVKLKDTISPTSTEFKIYFNDGLAFLDWIDANNDEIGDWKSSTRMEENEKEYTIQMQYYSLMYFRRFSRIPKKVTVYYLKYNGSKMELSITPTMEQILETENWYNKILAKMEDIMFRKGKPDKCTSCHIFCPFKNYCFSSENNIKYTVSVLNNYLFIDGPITPLLNKQLHRKFSYELKSSYFIKKHNPNINTTVKFWNEKKRLLPIGFKDAVLKTLRDYGDYLRRHEDKTVVVDVEDKRIFNEDKIQMPEKFVNGVILREYQNEAVDIFLKHKIGTLQIGTGGGKTEIAIETIRHLGVNTLFVTDRRELLLQTKERIEKSLGIEVGLIGYGEEVIKPVTVATIQTLSKHLNKYSEYLKKVRFVILDECHKVAAKSYWKLGHYLVNAEYRMGISGTATRDDGNEMMIFGTTGNIIFDLGTKTLIEKGYLIEPIIIFINNYLDNNEEGMLESNSKTGAINEESDYNLYYKNYIMDNVKRNTIVSDICIKHDKKKILILTRLVEHGEILKSIIPNSEHLWGSTEKELRKEMIEKFVKGDLNVLISTISIFSEGIDIPQLNMVINVAANSGDVKTIQILGRILRLLEGKSNAIYYDFIDYGKFFKRASFKRRRALLKQGHNVEVLTPQSI